MLIACSYNLEELKQSKVVDIPSSQPSRPASRAASHPVSVQAVGKTPKRRSFDKLAGILPTDAMKPESAISIQSYVTIVEDLVLRLQINVAIAKGFQDLEVPAPKPTKKQKFLSALGLADVDDEPSSKKWIDMWPIQMSAEIATAGEDPTRKNALTTNFDTYTLILQLGCILNTVPSWKRTYKLRVCVFVEYESDVEEERGRVTTLLRNLRIQAKVVVFWLASGDLKTYEVIINGSEANNCEEAKSDVNETLKDEEWWQDILRLRNPSDMSSSQELTHTENLLSAVTHWPSSSFQHGRQESKPKRFAELRKVLRRKHKTSLGNLVEAGLRMGMRTQRLPADLLSESASSSSDDDEEEDDDDEAAVTESEPEEESLEYYDLDASDEESSEQSVTPRRRAKSLSDVFTIPFIGKKINLPKPFSKDEQARNENRPTRDSLTPLKPHADAAASDTAVFGSASHSASHAQAQAFVRPPPIRHQSLPKFTSKPQPQVAVAAEETAGPSIMFVDSETSSPSTARNEDTLDTSATPAEHASSSKPNTTTTPTLAAGAPTTQPQSTLTFQSPPHPAAAHQQATGYPLTQTIPLSFNDLPCRAQHLILNELITQNSADTAVVFTTLPSPVEGTGKSEKESVKWISDLEVLCAGLPPTLLVHSNSMVVTMNL
jgi:potassium/chloride transporter 9